LLGSDTAQNAPRNLTLEEKLQALLGTVRGDAYLVGVASRRLADKISGPVPSDTACEKMLEPPPSAHGLIETIGRELSIHLREAASNLERAHNTIGDFGQIEPPNQKTVQTAGQGRY